MLRFHRPLLFLVKKITGKEHMTLFLQGVACGMAFYMMLDFINWMREE